MSDSIALPCLPLVIVVEGENDVSFLTSISTMLHGECPELPDLAHEDRVVFLPTSGSNLNDWVVRVAGLRKRAFFLFDREQEPETSQRRHVVESIKLLPGCDAKLTSKRTVENYLHPMAIREACGVELVFDDDAKVSQTLAAQLLMNAGGSFWHELSCKRQRRLHEKAKYILNRKAVQFMTRPLLAQQDPNDDVIGWLRAMRQLLDQGS